MPKKFLHVLPTILVGLLLGYTWYVIATTEYFATRKHQVALLIFCMVLIGYFFKFGYGVILTGVILLLATFNLIALLPDIVTSSYFIKIQGKEIATPAIQWTSLLLLIFFLSVNFNYLFKFFKSKGVKEKPVE